jgi:hypothetical protein
MRSRLTGRIGRAKVAVKKLQHGRERPLCVPPWRLSTDLNWFAIQQGTGRRPFPTRTFIGEADDSEQDLEAELNDPRIARVRVGLSDPPKSATREIEVRVIEVHLVKDVEHLGAELDVHAFVDLSVLEESHVEAEQVRSVQGSSANRSECSDVVKSERRRVKPDGLVRSSRRVNANTRVLGSIPPDTRLGVVSAAPDRKRPSTLVLAVAADLPAV